MTTICLEVEELDVVAVRQRTVLKNTVVTVADAIG
jgi:hypothetical protein